MPPGGWLVGPFDDDALVFAGGGNGVLGADERDGDVVPGADGADERDGDGIPVAAVVVPATALEAAPVTAGVAQPATAASAVAETAAAKAGRHRRRGREGCI